jgi:hypothetical protein
MAAGDLWASYSNFGSPPVDFCEPGSSILSTYKGGAYATMSGTSMASPHMAGILLWGAPVTDGNVINDPDGNADPIGVVGGETPNSSPTASFTFTATDLEVEFTDASSDSDGTVDSWFWDFGDGTSTSQNPIHTYDTGDTYTVMLTVTDNDGATGNTSQSITVTDPVTSDIVLTATGSKSRGVRYVTLAWDGADGDQVIIKENGSDYQTVPNDGYIKLNYGRTSGTFTFQICEVEGTACSNIVTVTI